MPHVLVAPDKFKGTLTAAQVAAHVSAGLRRARPELDVVAAPVADGGDGTVAAAVAAGFTRVGATVTGPLGDPVEAAFAVRGRTAVVELAGASGLALLGDRRDPLRATSRGTGELIRAAIEAGARTVIVGAGGSATTDGGSGAVDALRDWAPLDGRSGASVIVAADVRTPFVAAAATFARQKGASEAQVDYLTTRLEALADRYRIEFGRDVRHLPGSGAAGGLGGGLAALGATVRPGFEIVAERLGLDEAVRSSDLVITGEGRLDATSLVGKATGSMIELCSSQHVPAAVIAGQIAPGFRPPFPVAELVRLCGAEAAESETVRCIEHAAATLLGPGTP